MIWDMCGEEKARRETWSDQCIMASAIMFVIDVSSPASMHVARDELYKVLSHEESEKILADPALRCRVIALRFVLTEKVEDGAPWEAKARLCARGDLDPDSLSLQADGASIAPTLSSTGRAVLLQLIASHKWLLSLGDIKGAFLEAPNLQRAGGKLFGEGPHLVHQALLRHQPVQKTEPERLLRVHPRAGHHQLHGLGAAHQARQPLSPSGAR